GLPGPFHSNCLANRFPVGWAVPTIRNGGQCPPYQDNTHHMQRWTMPAVPGGFIPMSAPRLFIAAGLVIFAAATFQADSKSTPSPIKRPTPAPAPEPPPSPGPRPRPPSPCPGPGPCPHEARVGGPTDDDGTEIACELPGSQQLHNTGGSDGAGLCVFT